MYHIFRKNDTWVFYLSLLLTIGLFGYSIFKEPIYQLNETSILLKCVIVTALFVGSVFVNVLIEKNNLIVQKSHVPLIIGILFFINIRYLIFLNPKPVLAFFIALPGLLYCFSINNESKNNPSKLFNAGLFFGSASIVYPPAITLVLVLFCVILFNIKTEIKTLFLIIISCLLPWIYFYSYCYFTNTPFTIEKPKELVQFFQRSIPHYFTYSFIGILSLTLLTGLFKVMINYNKNSVKNRHKINVGFFCVIAALCSLLFFKHGYTLCLLLSSFIIIYALSKKFMEGKYWISEIIFSSLLGLSILFLFYSCL